MKLLLMQSRVKMGPMQNSLLTGMGFVAIINIFVSAPKRPAQSFLYSRIGVYVSRQD